MALVIGNLRRLGTFTPTSQGAATPGFFSYITADTLSTVVAANYFNNAASYLPVGSVIMVSAGFGGTPAAEHYVVASNDGATVAVTAAS